MNMLSSIIPAFFTSKEPPVVSKVILIVDDDESIREFLRFLLESRGFGVMQAPDANGALAEARKRPSLILLDVMMPEIDGWQVAKLLKAHPETNGIPIIFVTASHAVEDEVMGFEIGAIDYITKPFSIPSLVARITSVLKRVAPMENMPKIMMINEVALDAQNYTVSVDGTIIQLPKKEFEVLYYMARNANKLITRADLLSNVWGDDAFITERTIDVHIRQLRKKLGKYADYIETLKGVGYRVKISEGLSPDLKLIVTPPQE